MRKPGPTRTQTRPSAHTQRPLYPQISPKPIPNPNPWSNLAITPANRGLCSDGSSPNHCTRGIYNQNYLGEGEGGGVAGQRRPHSRLQVMHRKHSSRTCSSSRSRSNSRIAWNANQKRSSHVMPSRGFSASRGNPFLAGEDCNRVGPTVGVGSVLATTCSLGVHSAWTGSQSEMRFSNFWFVSRMVKQKIGCRGRKVGGSAFAASSLRR